MCHRKLVKYFRELITVRTGIFYCNHAISARKRIELRRATQIVQKTKKEAVLGFEPRMRESKSRVLTATLHSLREK